MPKDYTPVGSCDCSVSNFFLMKSQIWDLRFYTCDDLDCCPLS